MPSKKASLFLGRSMSKASNISEETMQKVDAEVRRIIDEQYSLARKLIEEKRRQNARHGQSHARMGNHRHGRSWMPSWPVKSPCPPRTGHPVCTKSPDDSSPPPTSGGASATDSAPTLAQRLVSVPGTTTAQPAKGPHGPFFMAPTST